jgi:DNA adenine methylase
VETKVYHRNAKTGGSDVWGTPPELFETLDREFSFTLDPCANEENAKADRFYTADQNGLLQSWAGERVFMNPPYSEIKAWARKAYEEARAGALVVSLVPARTGSKWFREYMAPGEVRFLTRRLKFLLPNGEPAPHSAGFDSAVVILGPGREPVTEYWDWEESPRPNEATPKGANRERPALRYYGGKFQIAPWIIEHFPERFPELHYIEPYGGSGAVLLRKAPSMLETYNDLDSAVVSFFRVLRERPKELVRALELTPYAREEYSGSQLPLSLPGSPEADLERARRFFVQYWQSVGGAPTRPGWKVGRTRDGRYTSNPESFGKAIGNLYRVANRLRKVQIENMDALELMGRTDSDYSLFYADPPYVRETRGSLSSSYAHELTDSDHVELAGVLRGLEGYVLLSGYESDLYSELYGSHDWVCKSMETLANSGRKTREVLWLNPRLARELEGGGA